MIPINGSNSSGVDLNKYVLKNVFNTVVNDLSDKVNNNKIAIDKINVDYTNDKFEWMAYDVSSEYTSEYNMKRCFNKYGDSFLIRETTITTIGEYEIHECHVKTEYGPNIQYNFISDYVYLPAYIRDKDNDKIIYHVAECDLLMNKTTINCSAKKIEFGEGWNRILIRFSSTIEHIKINSDCLNLGIGNNSVLKDIDLLNCYQLNSCEISNNPNFKNKCFLMSCTPTTFSTNNNNNTFLDITQNWFISGDGLWRGKFLGGWHYQDVEFFDRLGNGLIARITDSDNDSGFYKSVSGHDIITDYFKFPSMVTFSNDLYNDKRLVHVPRVAMNVYTDATFETNSIISNARILDFSSGITGVDWTYDNKVEKMIFSPSLTSLNLNYDTALTSINLIDCDKLTSLTIQNCPNITKIVLQHRPTTLNLDSTIKLIVLDEMNNSITTNTNNLTTLSTRVLTLENKPQTTYSRYTIENYEARPGDPDIQRVNMYFAFQYVKKITDNETGYIYYWDNERTILFEAVDNDEVPNVHLIPSCPNIGLSYYNFYVSGPQNFNYEQPYTIVEGFDLSNPAISSFKIAKLDTPWKIYLPPTIQTFEMIECFQQVVSETEKPVEIIKFPSTTFINTDTDTNKFAVKNISLS